MADNPLVSVIMGVYNVPKLHMIEASVVSVLNQSYRNFEFIVCDDGSSNETCIWLEEIAKRDNRIILLKNDKNMSLAWTLNRCISVSRGEFIARQDADDISDMFRFEKEVRFLQNNPQYDFVGTNCLLYNERTGVFGKREMPEFPQPEDFLFNSPFIHGSMMFRRTCLNTRTRYAVTKLTKRTEDYEMFMRMYQCGKRGANIQEPLYTFHYDENTRRVRMNFRIDEAKIRYKRFKKLGLLPKGVPYVVKPIVLGVIPHRMLNNIRKRFNRE